MENIVRFFQNHHRDIYAINVWVKPENPGFKQWFADTLNHFLPPKNDLYTFQNYRFFLADGVAEKEREHGKANPRPVHIIFLDIGQEYPDILSSPDIVKIIHSDGPSSIVWCSYGWERVFKFDGRKTELKWRTETINPSLRAGATYIRWESYDWTSFSGVLLACFERESHLPSRETVSEQSVIESSKNWKAVTAREEELLESDIIIAVMGPTGAGKSTLIKAITGANINIGHDLESCTVDISAFRIKVRSTEAPYNDHYIVIIDTPGFDDTNKSDLEIFKQLSAYLERAFMKQITLSGLIYLHRISDNRMAGTPLKNLRMFQSLCGKDVFKKIVIATSMWDEVEEHEGGKREAQLKKDYWSAMISKGSTVARFYGTRESAVGIVLPIVARADDVGPLRLQEELAESYLALSQTDAGKQMYSKLEGLLEQQKHAMSQIRRDVSKEESAQYREVLQKELDELSRNIQMVVIDMQYMKHPVPTIFSRFLRVASRSALSS